MTTKNPLRALPASPDDDLVQVPRLLTYEKTAELLGCGRTRVYELVRDKRLTAVRFGKTPMIPADEVHTLIQQTVAAAKKVSA